MFMKKLHFIGIIVCLIILAGCKYDPNVMVPMTPEEICDFMNRNFEGTFELTAKKLEDTTKTKINTATMKCSLFPEQLVLTRHGWEEDPKWGWQETFQTNYNIIFFSKEVENNYSRLLEDWFGNFEYKAVNASAIEFEQLQTFTNFHDYLNSSPSIRYNVVINAADETVRNYASKKAKSVFYDIKNRHEYPLLLLLYLWEDEEFELLTSEQIAAFSYEDKYFYNGLPEIEIISE